MRFHRLHRAEQSVAHILVHRRPLLDPIGGAERARTVDLLSAIQALVSRHLRAPPD